MTLARKLQNIDVKTTKMNPSVHRCVHLFDLVNGSLQGNAKCPGGPIAISASYQLKTRNVTHGPRTRFLPVTRDDT